MTLEIQFVLCAVLKHSGTRSVASSQWQYPFLLYIVPFLPLWFYQASRRIMVWVLDRYLRRYLLTNIHFPGDCLYLLALLSCSSLYERSILHILLSNYQITHLLLWQVTAFLSFSCQGIRSCSMHQLSVLWSSAWVSDFHFHLFLYLYVQLFTSSFKASFGSAVAVVGICHTEQLQLCSILVKILLLIKKPNKTQKRTPHPKHTHTQTKKI